MEETYLNLWDRLDEYVVEKVITEYECITIKAMCDKVASALSSNYESVKEGVKVVMGGEILEYEAKTLARQLTEQITKEVTEQLTKELTESVTKEVTESVTKEVTEQITKDIEMKAVANMLGLGIAEDKIREFYPDYFEEGKKKYLMGEVLLS